MSTIVNPIFLGAPPPRRPSRHARPLRHRRLSGFLAADQIDPASGMPIMDFSEPEPASAGASTGAQFAISQGADPGMINTLDALGASQTSLVLIGQGKIDPVTLLNELTGNSAAPGQPAGAAPSFQEAVFGPSQKPQGSGYGIIPASGIDLLSPIIDPGATDPTGIPAFVWVVIGGLAIFAAVKAI